MNRRYRKLRIEKRNRLLELAYIDPITGLGNYNAYLARAKEKLEKDGKKNGYYFRYRQI